MTVKYLTYLLHLFCVFSSPPSRPNRSSMICFSRGDNWCRALNNNFLSTFASMSFVIISSSVPRTSDNNNSFPSQSMFNGSSKETSDRILLFLSANTLKFSFSIHLDAYVANFIFFSGLKVFTAFINPIVPILIKSSILIPVFSIFGQCIQLILNFFQ